MIVYGAGYKGRIITRFLLAIGIGVSYVVDRDWKNKGLLEGIRVCSPSNVEQEEGCEICIATDPVVFNVLSAYRVKRYIFFEEIKKVLFAPYYDHCESFWEKYDRDTVWVNDILGLIRSKSLVSFDHLVMSVGQLCTLKCKYCSNLAPYSSEMNRCYSVRRLIDDFECVLNSVDFIFELQIQGGEPFVYNDLSLLLDSIYSNKIGVITIATNGTVIPNDSFFECVMNKNISIRISNYELSKTNEVRKVCDEHKIHSYVFDFYDGSSLWGCFGSVDTVYPEISIQKLESRYKKCPFWSCLTLEDGIIARCSRTVNASRVLNFKHNKGDVIDVRKCEKLRDELMRYYNNPHAMNACAYCLGGEGNRITPAEQL